MSEHALAPKCQVLLLAKGLGLICLYSLIIGLQCCVFVKQNATAQLQSQLADAKNRLENQEAKTRKADSKFQFSVTEMEKLKAGFKTEKNTWAEDKTALMQRAEKAEAALQELTTELTGLKCRASQMVSAIFG